jgi:hypothetical protein
MGLCDRCARQICATWVAVGSVCWGTAGGTCTPHVDRNFLAHTECCKRVMRDSACCWRLTSAVHLHVAWQMDVRRTPSIRGLLTQFGPGTVSGVVLPAVSLLQYYCLV